MEEDLECMICYEQIDKNLGNYILDICHTCKYAVHILCYEKYILINNRINKTDINANICLMCRKCNIAYNTPLLENRQIIHNIAVQSVKVCNLKIKVIVLFIILLIISIIVCYVFYIK